MASWVDPYPRVSARPDYLESEYERYVKGKRKGTRAPSERFWAFVEKHDNDCPCCAGCWIWTGALTVGYGRFCLAQKEMVSAHRFVYELCVGPIPDGLTIDHLCRNRACVNPTHLEPVTNVENVMRGESPLARNARKTHCVNGHAFTPENTYHRRTGGRTCLACTRIRKGGRPHWVGEVEAEWERRDLEHDRRMERLEDEQPDPTFAQRGADA